MRVVLRQAILNLAENQPTQVLNIQKIKMVMAKFSFDENKPNNGGDNRPNKTTVEITIPNDGSVKPGDNLKVTESRR